MTLKTRTLFLALTLVSTTSLMATGEVFAGPGDGWRDGGAGRIEVKIRDRVSHDKPYHHRRFSDRHAHRHGDRYGARFDGKRHYKHDSRPHHDRVHHRHHGRDRIVYRIGGRDGGTLSIQLRGRLY